MPTDNIHDTGLTNFSQALPADKTFQTHQPGEKPQPPEEQAEKEQKEQESTQPVETHEIADTQQNLADTQQAAEQAMAAIAKAREYAEKIGDQTSLQELEKILADSQTAQLDLDKISDAAKKLIELALTQQEQPEDTETTKQKEIKKQAKERTAVEKEEKKEKKTARKTEDTDEKTAVEETRDEYYEDDDIDILTDEESALRTQNIAAKKQAANDKKRKDTTAKQAKKKSDQITEADKNLQELLAEPIDFTQEATGLIRKMRPVLKNPKTRPTAIKHITNQLRTVDQTKSWPSSTKTSTGVTGKFGGARVAAKLANNLKQIGDEIHKSGKPNNKEARPFYKDAAISMLTALKNCEKNLPEFGYNFRRYIEEKVYPLFVAHRQNGEEPLTREAIFNELLNIRERRSDQTPPITIYRGSDQESLDTLRALI